MQAVVQQRLEAQRTHPGDQTALVGAIALVACDHAALFGQLFQRLGKSQHGVGGGGKAPFSMVIFHASPLGIQIQRQRARAAFTGLQFAHAGNDESESRHALNAFIGGAYQVINIQRGDIHRNTAEAAHCINDVAFTIALRQYRHLFDGVKHPGRGFAMNHGNMGDRRVRLEDPFDRCDVWTGDFAAVIRVTGNAHHFRHFNHPRPVGPVADDQHFALRADCAPEYRFDRVTAAALQ